MLVELTPEYWSGRYLRQFRYWMLLLASAAAALLAIREREGMLRRDGRDGVQQRNHLGLLPLLVTRHEGWDRAQP